MRAFDNIVKSRRCTHYTGMVKRDFDVKTLNIEDKISFTLGDSKVDGIIIDKINLNDSFDFIITFNDENTIKINSSKLNVRFVNSKTIIR